MSAVVKSRYHVTIIGGGISGMSTAWYLQKEAEAGTVDLDYTLLESSDHWGGKICSQPVEGEDGAPFLVEGGPDSFITQKPWALQLVRELGLEHEVLPSNDSQRKVYVLNNGKPTPLPDGVLLIVPTKFTPFALSPLISPLGKLRMGMDLFIPAKRDGEDETLAQFIQRRLGTEALDKIAEPLMSGIYNAEAERQSLLATFPRFRAMEEKHGSLIKGMLASRRARAQAPKAPADGRKPLTVFVSLRGGMGQLVDALKSRLNGDCRLNTGVESVSEEPSGGYRLQLHDGTSMQTDAVVLAVPSFVAAGMIKDVAPVAADRLQEIRYVSTGTISFAFRRSELDLTVNGFGVVVPRSEKRPINAITLSSVKFEHRAPDDCLLLRVFFGGSRSPETMKLDDEKLVAMVREELRSIMGITADPLFHQIYRWHEANPQYDVDHLPLIDAAEAALPPALYVTGSPYRGVGIPDCVHQAQTTAQAILDTVVEEPSAAEALAPAT